MKTILTKRDDNPVNVINLDATDLANGHIDIDVI